jgi:hypothetical protein
MNIKKEKKLIYNILIEVNQKQYNVCMNKFNGICAGKKENGKYFIKVLFMKYNKEVEQFLKDTND